MKVELLEHPNAVFSSEDKLRIDCDVMFEGNTVRFTASCLDTEEHGRFVYATLMLTPDKIASYVPPKPVELPKTEK